MKLVRKKWETEYLKSRFLLPTLLSAGYSVKLIFLYSNITKNSQQRFVTTCYNYYTKNECPTLSYLIPHPGSGRIYHSSIK